MPNKCGSMESSHKSDDKSDLNFMVQRIESLDEQLNSLQDRFQNNLYHVRKPLYISPADFFSDCPNHWADIINFSQILKRHLQRKLSLRNKEIVSKKQQYISNFRIWKHTNDALFGNEFDSNSLNFKSTQQFSSQILSQSTRLFNVSARKSINFMNETGGDAVGSKEQLDQVLLNVSNEDHDNSATKLMLSLALTPQQLSSNSKTFFSDQYICHNRLIPFANPILSSIANETNLQGNILQSDHQTLPITIWTADEQSIFFEQYISSPKHFARIAASLPYKNVSDCILYYYRNKKRLKFKNRVTYYRRGVDLNSNKN